MILLGLGSNIGDRQQNILLAIDRLQKHAAIAVQKISPLYETEPFGFKEQAAFLNAVLQITTALSPEALLRFCQQVELELGRERKMHWGPRTIDIDLLIFDGITLNTADLTLPHPYLAARRFVLVPMAQITNAAIIKGLTATELLSQCADEGQVVLYQEKAAKG